MQGGHRTKLGRVFVSSFFGELLPLRTRLAEAIGRAGLEPVLTERIAAHDASAAVRIEREFASCDSYVGLFRAAAAACRGASITRSPSSSRTAGSTTS